MNSLEFSVVLQPNAICCPLQSQVELHDKAKKGTELSLHKNYPLAYLNPSYLAAPKNKSALHWQTTFEVLANFWALFGNL